MTLRVRHLRLRVLTTSGMFGADIPFDDGLMILRADNSRGKSTAVKSLLFALGLEKMITAKSSGIITSAMRDRLIFDESTKAETRVLESYVSLEISGERGDIATLTRWAKHPRYQDGLISVVLAPALTEGAESASTDYFVGRGGSTSHPRGFHRWFESFIGWELPELPARDGRTAPLYLEQVMPLLFVEQRRGWAGIQAQMPYFSGVVDVRRRAIEFLLKLDVGSGALRRQQLNAELSGIEAQWKAKVSGFRARLEGAGLILNGLTDAMPRSWPPSQSPVVLQSEGDDWVPLDEALRRLRQQLAAAQSTSAIRPIGAVAAREERRLSDEQAQLDTMETLASSLRESLWRDKTELAAVDERLGALEEDEKSYEDIVILERLGSSELERLHDNCPVCHQSLPQTLLNASSDASMTPEDSLTYIRQQKDLFTAMRADSQRAVAAKEQRWNSLKERMAESRRVIRRLRSELTESQTAPSSQAIYDQVLLEQRLSQLAGVSDEFMGLLGGLMRLVDMAESVRESIRQLPAGGLSEADRRKLTELERSFVSQLRQYEFGSFSDERLRVSHDDYLPRRDDFDLQADISASDAIRVVWAYLLALLEISQFESTNHLGFLVFDEPRQQSAKDVSFKALLSRAASVAQGNQVIFATSEGLSSLRGMLQGVPHRLFAEEGYLLKPLPRS